MKILALVWVALFGAHDPWEINPTPRVGTRVAGKKRDVKLWPVIHWGSV